MHEAVSKYDIAILGGGIGGLTLAIQLAKKGRSVILIEKESYPFHKVCGEYISNESYAFLMSCGIKLEELGIAKIKKLGISAPNGSYISHPLEMGGFGISRYTLDGLLVEQARLAGAIIWDNCKATGIEFTGEEFFITTQKGTIHSRYAFGAFGKKSQLDLHLKRKFSVEKKKGSGNYLAVKYHIAIDFPLDLIELHNFEGGYCGISKIEGNRYCLCYLTNAKNLSKHNNSISEMEKMVLHRNPYLKAIFEQAKFLYDKPLTISQIRFEPKTQIENHLILLGDSAGLITPLCGNGMSMAMRAAKIISQLLPANLEDAGERKKFEVQFQKAWKQAFSTRLKFGRIFQKLFGSVYTTHLILVILKPFPGLLNKLVRLTHGEVF